jgi:hypothetical protein
MGGWFSKNEENKNIENDGQVTNNVVIGETVDIHNFEIIVLLYIITILKLIEFACFLYRNHTSKLKKKFIRSTLNLNNHSTV